MLSEKDEPRMTDDNVMQCIVERRVEDSEGTNISKGINRFQSNPHTQSYYLILWLSTNKNYRLIRIFRFILEIMAYWNIISNTHECDKKYDL